MDNYNIKFSVLFKVAIAFVPMLFGMYTFSAVACAYVIAVSLLSNGPLTCAVSSMFTVILSVRICATAFENGKTAGFYIGLFSVLTGVICAITILKNARASVGTFAVAAGGVVPVYAYLLTASGVVGKSINNYLSGGVAKYLKTCMQLFSENYNSETAAMYPGASGQLALNSEYFGAIIKITEALVRLLSPSMILLSVLL